MIQQMFAISKNKWVVVYHQGSDFCCFRCVTLDAGCTAGTADTDKQLELLKNDDVTWMQKLNGKGILVKWANVAALYAALGCLLLSLLLTLLPKMSQQSRYCTFRCDVTMFNNSRQLSGRSRPSNGCPLTPCIKCCEPAWHFVSHMNESPSSHSCKSIFQTSYQTIHFQ